LKIALGETEIHLTEKESETFYLISSTTHIRRTS